MGRPKKKVILFIVEGPSDMAALERPIQNLLTNNKQGYEATFLIAEQDVTSDRRNNPDNILQKINKWYFDPFFSANEFYYPKDIAEVVQICDLDGAFIPEEFCCDYKPEHQGAEGFIYDPPYIFGEKAQAIIDRNNHKAQNIRYLLNQSTIKVRSKTVPYSIYFFSSNIDHYLHDKVNLVGRDKIKLAEQFADMCEESSEWFTTCICDHPQALKNMSFKESWEFIMKADECNSIKRYTNFNIYIDALLQKISSTEEC